MKLIDESIDTVKFFDNPTLNLLKCWEVSYKSKDMMLGVTRAIMLEFEKN